MSVENNVAKHEIHKTLRLCNFCTRKVGLSFIDDPPKNLIWKISINLWLLMSATVLFLMVASEIGYVATMLVTSSSVVEFVSSLHIVGYDTMSFGKLVTIWYKKDVFKHLLKDLEDIWPVSVQDREDVEIKSKRLSALRVVQFWYAFWNILGVWLYNLTPIVVYLYRKIQGKSAYLGYIWLMSYPFDKTKPGYHEFVFVFEAYCGVVSVWCMLGSDMLFMTMSSHISMLLKILQVKIRRLGNLHTAAEGITTSNKMRDCYTEIVSVIKIHQRLIKYGNDLEDAFSVVNLINVLLSSINICCVVFNILLDPWMAMSNKFFLGAALTQVGILCCLMGVDAVYGRYEATNLVIRSSNVYVADLLYMIMVPFRVCNGYMYMDRSGHQSSGVGDAVYESGWYNTNTRCRRTLFVLIQRSQKPLYFTAYKFRSITMSTYSSIITSSYSYFTLLYTVYRGD